MTTIQQWDEITPRYGRDYRSAAEATKAFREGLADFTLAKTGQAMTIVDVPAGTTVMLRYRKLTMVTTLKVTQAMIDAAKEARR